MTLGPEALSFPSSPRPWFDSKGGHLDERMEGEEHGHERESDSLGSLFGCYSRMRLYHGRLPAVYSVSPCESARAGRVYMEGVLVPDGLMASVLGTGDVESPEEMTLAWTNLGLFWEGFKGATEGFRRTLLVGDEAETTVNVTVEREGWMVDHTDLLSMIEAFVVPEAMGRWTGRKLREDLEKTLEGRKK